MSAFPHCHEKVKIGETVARSQLRTSVGRERSERARSRRHIRPLRLMCEFQNIRFTSRFCNDDDDDTMDATTRLAGG
jgi:hypothetical protein